MQVRDVMTRDVVSVGPDTSTRHAAEVLAGHGFAALPVVDAGEELVGVVAELRSVPVLEHGRLTGIVSRCDPLRALARPDAELCDVPLGLVEACTGEPRAYEVEVVDGVATARRVAGTLQPSAAVEERAVGAIPRTAGGVLAVRVCAKSGQTHVPTGGTR